MNSVQFMNPQSSVFDLTHDVKLSCNMGYLVPSMVMDCVPGDNVNLNAQALIRYAPMTAPIYHRTNVTFHAWAVPYRILWENWSDYITETKTAGVLPAFPFITMKADGTNYTVNGLTDYLGVPPPQDPVQNERDEKISAMRFAAYQCAVSEFYRDQNLVTEINWQLDDGDNTANPDLFLLRKRAWGHDYFTSNLPFAQKGESVQIPVAGNAPIKYSNDILTPSLTTMSFDAIMTPPGPGFAVDPIVPREDQGDVTNNTMYADLSQSNATTVNDLRLAEALQKYLERAARAGTRLVEWIKGMFGVTLPDYTAQRPQYIGGLKTPVQISEVLNTAGEAGGLPQGNMSGRGIGVSNGNLGHYTAREHCVIVVLMSIMPETAYQQGLDREWLKVNDPKDFLNPMFARLGEQETFNSEIFAYMDNGLSTFGYLPRYSEYRTLPNRVAGDFRTTQNYWHMGRIFDTQPALNQDFIECNPTHRIFADTDPLNNKVYVHVLNGVRAVRPLPKYGTPSL